MAFSGSIKRAQAVKLCELCRGESVSWRCIDCGMCLCEKCKVIHLRVPVTAQHEIITIETPIQDVKKKVIIDNIPCRDHPKKMTCLFCRSCDSLICPDCVASVHKKHNFDSIESALDDKLDNLSIIHDQIDATLKFSESKTLEVRDIKLKCHTIFDESLTNIKQKEQELIDAIRKHSRALQKKVENERSGIIRILSTIEQDIHKTKEDIERQKNETKTTMSSNQGHLIFNAMVKVTDPKFSSLPNEVTQFTPKRSSIMKCDELFGSFHQIFIHDKIVNLPEMELEVIETFTTDLPFINQIVTLEKTSAWINSSGNKVIRELNIKRLRTSKEVSIDVNDIAVTLNSELLLSMANGCDVNLLKRSGEIVPFLSMDPLLPRGIHVTKYDTIMLGVREPGNTYTPTEQSQRAIIVYGIDGKQKRRFQYDKEGRRLLTLPYRITTNINQDILIIDITSGNTGRIICLDRTGNLKWSYRGHHEIDAKKQFDPRGIVTTTLGHIIISDYGSHALHILSTDGEIMTCKTIRDLGVMRPCCLDIDNAGRLWLGCGTAKNDIDDAKLHVIDLIY